MPCFTAFRVRVFTECLHAYAFDVALKTSREHAFLKDLLELLFLESPTKFSDGPDFLGFLASASGYQYIQLQKLICPAFISTIICSHL